MTDRLEDQMAIATLMSDWLHRDLARWDALGALFHPGATIEITWFRGLATEFVERSKTMGATNLATRHLIGAPQIRFAGDKAFAETPMMVVAQDRESGLGATTHSRFLDCVEKRDGRWGLVERRCSYDLSSFDFARGPVEIDFARLDPHPLSYAALAYLLEGAGFPVKGPFSTRGSDLEASIRRSAEKWLQN
jgi:hypothetical protein